MVNTQLFQTRQGALLPQATARNHEQAPAYALSAKHQLAQLAATGCLNQTFYANAEQQLDAVTTLAQTVDASFVAKTAAYARQAAQMKDMPVVLAALLSVRDVSLLTAVFSRVVDNGKTLRAFVQMLRSGTLGRKSLGARPKKLVQQWLLTASEKQLLNAAVGNTPSLADVVKMVHPKPAEAWRAAWFAWLIGKSFDEAALPPITQAFERFKRDATAELPDVPFQMLTALELNAAQWAQIARTGSWQMVRQNLNTFARHGVFELDGMADVIAAKLRDPQAVAKARVLPYQLLAAYKAASDAVPMVIRDALQDAMEHALANVPCVRRSRGRVPRRVGLDELGRDGPARLGNVGRALHRHGRAVGRGGVAQEPAGACAAVRAGCRQAVIEQPRLGDDQCASLGVDRWRGNQLQRAAGATEQGARDGGLGGSGVGQRVVDGRHPSWCDADDA